MKDSKHDIGKETEVSRRPSVLRRCRKQLSQLIFSDIILVAYNMKNIEQRRKRDEFRSC